VKELTPGGQLRPSVTKFASRGEVKNGPQVLSPNRGNISRKHYNRKQFFNYKNLSYKCLAALTSNSFIIILNTQLLLQTRQLSSNDITQCNFAGLIENAKLHSTFNHGFRSSSNKQPTSLSTEILGYAQLSPFSPTIKDFWSRF
jgi:hypothetical protein